jgi:integrase
MSVKKRTYGSGKTVWHYVFDAPGSTRATRRQIKGSGYATKQAAVDAEAARRVEEQKKIELKARGAVDAPLPKTLDALLDEFLKEHAQKKLAPKTVERYREQAAYLAPELREMAITDITPLHLGREWNRLLESGGHTRKSRDPRPLSAKTVQNIAGVVSSAFTRAIRWGLVTTNPVENSEPPHVEKHLAIALTPAQEELVLAAASGPWCLGAYLGMAAATGCRRGELLALRWGDVVGGAATISRSLSQTRTGLHFKGTKTGKPRRVALPDSVLARLEAHRKRQDEFRVQFGPDYRTDLDLVFAQPDGLMLRPDSISASVSALFKRLKIPKPKGAALHLLRHTHTSVLLSEGVPLPAVSARLGHSSVRTTQEIYAHMITGQDEEAARRWDESRRREHADSTPSPSKPI